MTVKELIAKLEEMPQDAEVIVETLTFEGTTVSASLDEVFETYHEEVCLQGVR